MGVGVGVCAAGGRALAVLILLSQEEKPKRALGRLASCCCISANTSALFAVRVREAGGFPGPPIQLVLLGWGGGRGRGWKRSVSAAVVRLAALPLSLSKRESALSKFSVYLLA